MGYKKFNFGSKSWSHKAEDYPNDIERYSEVGQSKNIGSEKVEAQGK